MQLDLDTVRWLLSGFFLASGAVISLLLNRELRRLDAVIHDHDTSLDALDTRLSTYKLHVAETYVSKTDLEKQLSTHLDPIRNDMRELKGDVKALLQRP